MRYNEELKSFIVENCIGRTTKELTELINKTFGLSLEESAVKAFKGNHRLKSGLPSGNPKGFSTVYSQEVQEFIRQNHKGITTYDLTELINQTFGTDYKRSQLKGYLSNHGLSNGVDCRKRKGQVSFNKGLKWKDFMSPEGQAASRQTTFKPGNIPLNHRPVGSERISKDGYVEIKIAEPNKWALKHRIIYEQSHGNIPKGFNVIFLDGDRLNLSIDNLVLVSQAEHVRLNQSRLRFNDQELTKTGVQIAKLKTIMGKRNQRNI